MNTSLKDVGTPILCHKEAKISLLCCLLGVGIRLLQSHVGFLLDVFVLLSTIDATDVAFIYIGTLQNPINVVSVLNKVVNSQQ